MDAGVEQLAELSEVTGDLLRRELGDDDRGVRIHVCLTP
jgi:hypothetical protein